MIPGIFQAGIVIFEWIQVLVAFIAIILAIKWKKTEFLAGLIFLFIYTVLDMVDVFYFMIMQEAFIDFAQFGIILLAIIFFIIGMHPEWSPALVCGRKKVVIENKSPKTDSIFTDLRKF